jgi:hypothetical protein
MALSLDIMKKPGHIQVNVTGQFDMKEAVERFPEVIFACRQYDINMVLIDF